MQNHKVLILTGGYVTPKDKSLKKIVIKQKQQNHYAKNSWLDHKIKLNFSEPILLAKYLSKKLGNKLDKTSVEFLEKKDNFLTPELTEVVLMTLLHRESIPYESLTYDDLYNNPDLSESFLQECTVVFASSTFLRDLSELIPLLKKIKRSHNKVIFGGALAGIIYPQWQGHTDLDILAIGYGEYLVPSLAEWIRSNFQNLNPPKYGKIEKREQSVFLFSGVPQSLNLDDLITPEWKLAEDYHNRKYPMISYESVRGCPYRCAFCNYPYLFDDKKFRMKSAIKMASDWEYYYHSGVRYITCLDSLFTMPKRRIIDFCNELIVRKVKIKWICYARADDLTDLNVVKKLLEAGCIQVQIGIERGDQNQLNNMNKRIKLEQNAQALKNCKQLGLTSVISLIIGYPGETAKSLNNTLKFLKQHPPDFHFLCVFSTRVPGVPILQPQMMDKFGLQTDQNPFTVSPYWKHNSMDCAEASIQSRVMQKKIIENKISLDATLFYGGILDYNTKMKDSLLDFQSKIYRQSPILSKAFSLIHFLFDKMLKKKSQDFFKKSTSC